MSSISGFQLSARSTVAVGEAFSLGIKALTPSFFADAECYAPSPGVKGRYNLSPRGLRYMDNVPSAWDGKVRIDGGQFYQGPACVDFAEGTGPYPNDQRPIRRIDNLAFTQPGTHFLSVIDETNGLRAVSNPIRATSEPPSERLWWGDLHCQTFFSDGLRCPEELYYFARDEAFLDIFALSDHSERLTERQWEYFVHVTNDFNAPGRFVTLIGLEWTSGACGHRNVYYPGDFGPCLRATDPDHNDLQGLYARARQYGALVIPHHSANSKMGVDWSLGHDSDLERLVEIYSVWGSSERPASLGNSRPIRIIGGEQQGRHVLDALKMGRRFGLIGGGDIHDGRPGDEMHTSQSGVEIYRQLYRQGIMGVWAKELTRESIFEALWNRRVFATTNIRMFLRFAVDDQPMGSEIVGNGVMPIVVEAASEVPIARIDLVLDGEDAETIYPRRYEVFWETERPFPARPAWCYARITREDGEMAWSSPVWISPA